MIDSAARRVEAMEYHPRLKVAQRIGVVSSLRQIGSAPGVVSFLEIRHAVKLERRNLIQRQFRGQFPDRLILKHLVEGYTDSKFPERAQDTNAPNGISAKREEIVLDPYLFQAQNLFPQGDEQCFRLGSRWHVSIVRPWPVTRWHR